MPRPTGPVRRPIVRRAAAAVRGGAAVGGVALAAAAVAGCDRAEVARLSGDAVALTQTDFRIAPQHVRVRPGTVTFTVRNTSRLPHNWQLERGSRRLARILTLQPGEEGSVTVRLRRGTYRMSCGVSHHKVLGEYGTVVVR